MGIGADITLDWHAAQAALAWQLDMGVDEVICDTPASAYDLPDRADWQKTGPAVSPRSAPQPTTVSVSNLAKPLPSAAIDAAQAAAQRCQTLDDLHEAMARFDLCEIKKGARNFVFGTGNPRANLLVLGDAPNREDERDSMPFSGIAGQLLDRMFAAIGLTRENPDPAAALYLTCALPWRTPQDRDPDTDEIDMIRPFVRRHVELIAPKVVVLMGNAALQMGIKTTGIQRSRGVWGAAFGVDAMPMVTPAFLMTNPAAKQQAWADLLAIKARLNPT